jgi:Do/DeqQ family serine protease
MPKPTGSIRKSFFIVFSLVALGVIAGVLLTARMEWTAPTTAQITAPPVNMNYTAQATPFVTESGESPFVAVAERVANTVVNITSNRKMGQTTNMEDMFRDSPFWEFFHRGMPDQQQPDRRRKDFTVPSTGSGIIISSDGYILTNNHVVEKSEKITVKLHDEHEYTAELIGADPETDVALIKIKHDVDPSSVALIGNSEKIKIGDWAIAVGNPLGLDWTLTVGVISAKGRSGLAIQGGGPSYQDFIQTDASINFGNSGGPLCNIHGEVIGVNAAINPSGQGIGFAIPINMAMKVVDQLRDRGKVSRGYLGMQPRELTAEFKSAMGLPEDAKGVFVEKVDKNTPAEKGGLEASDVITEFGGRTVNDVAQFRMAVADFPPGSEVTAKITRNGKNKELTFTLGDRGQLASFMGKGNEPEPASETWLGLSVESVTESMGRAMDLEDASGVIVTDVDPDGPAAGKIQERDVIIEIDRQPIKSVSDFRKVADSYKDRKKAILFRVIRNGQKTFEAVEPEKG